MGSDVVDTSIKPGNPLFFNSEMSDQVKPTSLHQWLNSVSASVSYRTHERYKEICDKHLIPALGHHKLNKLQPLHIETYYVDALKSGHRKSGKGLSKQTVLHHHCILREALQRAMKWGILARNPADAVDPPRPDKSERLTFTTAETLDVLKSAKGTRLYLPILLAVTTGMRRGEILGLRWQDIDLKARRLAIRQMLEQTRSRGLHFKEPKTHKSTRSITLPQVAIQAIKEHKKQDAELRLQLGLGSPSPDSLIFMDATGGVFTSNALTSGYRDFRARHKLKHVTFHDRRHSHATHLLESNLHPKIVSERLGHSTIAITLNTYSHILPNIQEEAAAATDKVFKKIK